VAKNNNKLQSGRFSINFTIKIITFALLSFIIFSIYSNAFKAPFVFDDYVTIVENNDLHNYSILSKWNISRYIGHLTFALNYHYNKLNPHGYHIVNIAIHIINSFLVFLLFTSFFQLLRAEIPAYLNYFFSLIGTLIFATHPVQTQAVSYISQRFASLAALFAMASIYLFIKFRINESHAKYIFYALSLMCALLAYKTKENTATLPLAILLLERILFKNSTSIKKIIFIIPYFLLLSVIIISFISINKPIGIILQDTIQKSVETQTISRLTYLMTQFRVITTYVRLLFFPAHQSIDYYYPLSKSFFETKTFLSFIFICIIIIAATLGRKSYSGITLGIGWFFIFLLVESSIIPIRDVIFEHRIYLPSVGFIFSLVFFTYILTFDKQIENQQKIISKATQKKRKASTTNKESFINIFKKSNLIMVAAISLAIIITLSFLTYKRNFVWKDEVELWKDAVRKFPENPRAHLNLGTSLSSANRCQEAIPELIAGLKIMPNNARAHSELSYCYWSDNSYRPDKFDIALHEMELAIFYDPSKADYYFNYALLLMDGNRFYDAINALEKAKQINPNDPQYLLILGKAYCQVNNIKNGLENLYKSISLDAKIPLAHHELAICLLKDKQFDLAYRELQLSLQLNPELIDSHFYLALIYEQWGNPKAAFEQYELFLSKASADNPLLPIALRNQKSLKY